MMSKMPNRLGLISGSTASLPEVSPAFRPLPLVLAAFQTTISERRAALIPAWRNLSSAFRGRQAFAKARERRRSDWFTARRLEKVLEWPAYSLPTADGRAGAYDFLHLLVELVIQRRPEVVVEFGSGISTLVLARALQMNGTGRLVSFEHKQGFAELARSRLQTRGLTACITVAPLISADCWGCRGKWYDAASLPPNIDLLVVDGPPAYFAPETRESAGPAVFPYLSDSGILVLDDAKRPGERTIARRWRAGFPNLSFLDVDTHKGTLLGMRREAGLGSAILSPRWRVSTSVEHEG